MKTEQEMQKEKAPTLETMDELTTYINSLTEREHDYGTCVYAMSLAATAAFNHVASKLGITGFQASCADMDIIRRTRHIESPFALITAEKALYPQYDIKSDVDGYLNDWQDWLKKAARDKLKESEKESVHTDVWAHWERLAEAT
ncbi:hypothetical protein GZ77_09535 [Endozoicomonas montiporae]|uniref:Uncharacterized protein n=2 Tax=Endozoicomonas montiporae TaxID=1027273 RepID=A0A081N7Y9_9GAMM|nr:hypothetical protein [Endozoicomonas montiporae]AMO55571.1 hypothetical protein EZMO1_1383 [Endozoicomonas montiporae CL-33]KEQ14562.1 hypothetical protein GZ77_09535 [Endozoicomonas montiporae]